MGRYGWPWRISRAGTNRDGTRRIHGNNFIVKATGRRVEQGMFFIRIFFLELEEVHSGYTNRTHPGNMDIMTNSPHSSNHTWAKQHSQAKSNNNNISQIAQAIGQLLDASLTIPGTTIKIGLDPLIGLIPGIGDLISNGIGSSLLFLATKAGVPRIVILRMSLNIVLNMVIGAIPVMGDLFSIWFKSNLQNAQLLHRHSQTTVPVTTLIDWVYVSTIVIGIILILGLTLSALLWVGASLLALFDLSE